MINIPKMNKWDIVAVVISVVLLIAIAYPVYMPTNGCEVARPGYKCESAKNIMIENCNYLVKYNCDITADVSIPQIKWYNENLCTIHNDYHADKLDCSNMKNICNQVMGENVC